MQTSDSPEAEKPQLLQPKREDSATSKEGLFVSRRHFDNDRFKRASGPMQAQSAAGDAGGHVRLKVGGKNFDEELTEAQGQLMNKQISQFQRTRTRGSVHTVAHQRDPS